MTGETELSERRTKSRRGRGVRFWAITVVVALLLIVLAFVWAYRVLEQGGAFSPTKCAANGGRWDEGIEVCNFD